MRDDYTRLFALRGRWWFRKLHIGIPWYAIGVALACALPVWAITRVLGLPPVIRLVVIAAVGWVSTLQFPFFDQRRVHEYAASALTWAAGWAAAAAARATRPRVTHVAVRAWRQTR